VNAYDRWLTDAPPDNRTDEEIEDDAADRVRRLILLGSEKIYRPDKLWDAVEAKRIFCGLKTIFI